MVKVKICGLTNRDDAEWAAQCGADFLGFVLEPTSPRCVGSGWSPKWLLELGVPTVAVFGVVAEAVASEFDYVQAHTWNEFADERGRFVVTRIRAEREAVLPQIRAQDWSLLDAYHPNHHGGAGIRTDVELARALASIRRVFLAGGLSPDNVAEAIQDVNPAGVDVSSGVEKSPGLKDRQKVLDFIQAAKGQ